MIKTELSADGALLTELTNINVILGRNGAGKSRFLRNLDSGLAHSPDYYIRYVSPERAGIFRREGHIDTNIERDVDFLRQSRSRNQAENFKAASASLLREVEIIYLRRLQSSHTLRADPNRNFQADRLDKINSLLANITVEQERANFIFKNHQGEIIPPDQISSGESEAVALATEVLYFFETIDEKKFNVLLVDEPDVHLHPDLQARLANFIISMLEGLTTEVRQSVALCISTHSTPFVCALSSSQYTSIGNKEFGASTVRQSLAPAQLRKIAPFFGHPLSLTLSNDTLLILEGKDDERVWQQATRTAQGGIKLFPVLANSVDQQTDLEKFCAKLLLSLYDHPKAYSLRDGDGIADDLPNIGPVERFRLKCYSIENLLLTNECLALMNTTWEDFCTEANEWIARNLTHRDSDTIKRLIESPDRMRNAKIKSIRLLICEISRTKKNWETVVGQTIGTLHQHVESENSIFSFLGEKASLALLKISKPNQLEK
ncbi:ATP-binding protein [Xanthomonas sacchari]|uniref:ATP-binding protein n=1 Tax=Xanthomonas sacchari TaxID=56458 RepID=UPI00225E60B1|nr:ATP-binding protein [Xanthomonas sacchari]MCW0436157.1 hypothetical protein [Xanthomonas sacchari]